MIILNGKISDSSRRDLSDLSDLGADAFHAVGYFWFESCAGVCVTYASWNTVYPPASVEWSVQDET